MARDTEAFDRSEALLAISETAGIPMEELFEVLAGNIVDIPGEILDGFSTTLGMDREELDKLNEGDTTVFPTVFNEEADEEEEDENPNDAVDEEEDT